MTRSLAFVGPHPFDPLSLRERGNEGPSIVPPLHMVERGTGGEDRARGTRASEGPASHSLGSVYVTSFPRQAQSTNTHASSQRRRAFFREPPRSRTSPSTNAARPTAATMAT